MIFEKLFTRHQQQHRIELASNSSASNEDGDTGRTILTYVQFGFEHILIGLDHIAFLLTLMLLARRWRDVLFIVTGFTLGHSLTLSLTVLGFATPRPMVVEALIGFTIAIVAVENIVVRERTQARAALTIATISGLLALLSALSGLGPPALSLLGLGLFSWCYLQLSDSESAALRLRPAITTLFGMIHGFGFASVLLEVGLPGDAVIPALFGFNVGVELGQVAIVSGLALAAYLWSSMTAWRPVIVNHWANAGLCALGTYWFFQRLYY